jgi:hypothetical protein
VDRRSRTHDGQAARSGKQNIVEGSMASATSKKADLKLIGVARASLKELLLECQDFLRAMRFGAHHVSAILRRTYLPTNNKIPANMARIPIA